MRAFSLATALNSARAEARRNGFDEAIFLTDDGAVSKGSAAHLFLVRRGELVSPPSTENNLDGILPPPETHRPRTRRAAEARRLDPQHGSLRKRDPGQAARGRGLVSSPMGERSW